MSGLQPDNRGMLIASIFIAIVLWLHIATERIAETEIRLQPRIVGLTDDEIVSISPSSKWRLRVEGTGKSLLRHSPDELPLIVDVSALPAGEHRFSPVSTHFVESPTQDHIRVTLVPGLGPQIAIPRNKSIRFGPVLEPTNITLDIETLVRSMVPVVPFIEADRFSEIAIMTSVTVIPDSLELIGPLSSLGTIRSIKTALIHPEVRELQVTFPSESGPDESVSISPEKRSVTIEIDAPLDLSRLDHHTRCNRDGVRVQLTLSPIIERTFVSLPVRFVNKPAGLDVGIDSNELTVTLAGPADVIESVDEEELEPFVDLRPFRSGGVYSATAEIPLIERVSIRAAQPRTFKITLTPRASDEERNTASQSSLRPKTVP